MYYLLLEIRGIGDKLLNIILNSGKYNRSISMKNMSAFCLDLIRSSELTITNVSY